MSKLALDLYGQGILLVPTKGRGEYQVAYANWREKFPSIGPYTELWTQFASSQPEVMCGVGGIAAIDVDEKNRPGIAAAFDEELRISFPNLYLYLYVERTASGGYHYFFKHEGLKSEDLAFSPVEQTLEEEFSGAPIKYRPTIELKGAMKLCRVCPCEGIEKLQGDILSLPVVSSEDIQHLRYIASLFNEREEEAREIAKQKSSITVTADSPGKDYAANVETTVIVALLEKHGWKVVKGNAYRGRITLNRPGAKTHNVDADILDRVFNVWSSSVDGFTVGEGLSFFSLYGRLEHNGDYKAAAKALKDQGWGRSVTVQHGEVPLRQNGTAEWDGGVSHEGADQAEIIDPSDALWAEINDEIERSWNDEDTEYCLSFRHQVGASSEVFGVASPGMIVLVGGRHKSRKSAFISALIASNIANQERCGHRLDGTGMIIWFDTEQSKRWVKLSRERMMVMGNIMTREEFERRVIYVPMAGFSSPTKKMAVINEVLGRFTNILAVILDGAKDIVFDVNDNKECTAAVGVLRAEANRRMFVLITVMHINKLDRNMNGHMGGILEKICDFRYDVVYDEDTTNSLVSCAFSRGERVPPFTFEALRGNIPQILGYQRPEYNFGEYFPPKAIEGQIPDTEPDRPFSLPSTTYEQRVSLIGGHILEAADLEEMNRRARDVASNNLTDAELEQLYGND